MVSKKNTLGVSIAACLTGKEATSIPSGGLCLSQLMQLPRHGPATHVGNHDEAPGSWLRPGSALAVIAFCGVNHWLENSRSLSHMIQETSYKISTFVITMQ